MAYADDLLLVLSKSPTAAEVALKLPKCRIVPLRRHDCPSELAAPAYSVAIAAAAPPWHEVPVVDSAPYLGFWLGPGATSERQWRDPLAKAMARSSGLADRRLAPSLLAAEHDRRAVTCVSYVAQLCMPTAAMTRVSDSLTERLLHFPHHALPRPILRGPNVVGMPAPRRLEVEAWAALIAAAPRHRRNTEQAAAFLDAAREHHAPLSAMASRAAPEAPWLPAPAFVDILRAAGELCDAAAAEPSASPPRAAPSQPRPAIGGRPSSGRGAPPPTGGRRAPLRPPRALAGGSGRGGACIAAGGLRRRIVASLAPWPPEAELAKLLAARLARTFPDEAARAPPLEDVIPDALAHLRGASPAVACYAMRLWLNALPSAHRTQQGHIPCRACGAPWETGAGDTLRHMARCERLWAAAAEAVGARPPASLRERLGLACGIAPATKRSAQHPSLTILSVATETFMKLPLAGASESCLRWTARDAASRLASQAVHKQVGSPAGRAALLVSCTARRTCGGRFDR